MQQADDLALSSKWSITFHDPKSPRLYASSLGAFSTISGFWRLYRSMLDHRNLTNLPVTVNISVYRESAYQCTKPWHGEWNIDLHHDTNPMRIYQQIILLAIGEQLTSQIRGLVLERRRDPVTPSKTHFSLSIFTDVKDPDLDIKNVLLSNNVISLDHCVSGKITFRPFQLLHIPTTHSHLHSHSGHAVEHKEEEEDVLDGDMTHIRCIKYSMASLLKYKESINNVHRVEGLPNFDPHSVSVSIESQSTNLTESQIPKMSPMDCNGRTRSNSKRKRKRTQNTQNIQNDIEVMDVIDGMEALHVIPTMEPLNARSLSLGSVTSIHSVPRVPVPVHNLAESRRKRHCHILPDFKHRQSVLRLFGPQCTTYSLSVLSVHDVITDNLQSILMSEGCIVCMGTTLQSPYTQEMEDGPLHRRRDTHDDREMDEQKGLSPVQSMAHLGGTRGTRGTTSRAIHGILDIEYRDSFLVAECAALKCKHVAHCECIVKAVNHISIRGAHCSQFFETVELSSLSNPEIQKEIGYHINTDNVTGKIYNFSFRINHLISHNSAVSPQWPITVPSYYHNQSGGSVSVSTCGPGTTSPKEECLQIFFDNTELQIRRGTLQIAIAETKAEGAVATGVTSHSETSPKCTFLHTVNFEIPPPPQGHDVDPKITNKIYQLRYVDPATQQVLVVNINMKLRPNYALQLLSLRYEFNPNAVAIAKSTNNNNSNTVAEPADSTHSGCVSQSPLPVSLLTSLAGSVPMLSPSATLLPTPPLPLAFPIQNMGLSPVPSVQSAPPITTTTSSTLEVGNVRRGISEIARFSGMNGVANLTEYGASMGSMPNVTINVPQIPITPLASVPTVNPVTGLAALAPATMPLSGLSTAIPMMPLSASTSIPLQFPFAHDGISMLHFNDTAPTAREHIVNGSHSNLSSNKSSPRPTTCNVASSAKRRKQYALNLNESVHNDMELYHYVCTDYGTKHICDKIQDPKSFGVFFEKLKTFFPLLMMHNLGHTVCRAIYSQPHCTMRHKLVFLQSLAVSFTKIASNRQGSFALICILSLMTTDSELQIINAAFNRIVACGVNGANDEQFDDIILSQSGYHVIKKLVSFGHPHFECILQGIAVDFSKYATHHYGVPIIRSILDLIAADDVLIRRYRKTLELFASHTSVLVRNQFGNYVMQQLMEITPPSISDSIKDRMRGEYSTLAKHKFASNVVEKCLKHSLMQIKEASDGGDVNGNDSRSKGKGSRKDAPPTCRGLRIQHQRVNIVDHEQKEHEYPRTVWVAEIIRELLIDAPELINHKFGNYCLQTALTVAIEAEPYMMGKSGRRLLDEFVQIVSPSLNCLRQNVRNKWHQLLLSATNHKYEGQWNRPRRGPREYPRRSRRAPFHHHY